MKSSIYAALEGLEGTGKTTVLPMIAGRLQHQGLRVQIKPEFPAGRLDDEFREALLNGLFLGEHLKMSPQAAFFYLLFADTFALSEVDFSGSDVVLADRCHLTQTMYQAYFASQNRESFSAERIRSTLEELYCMFGLPLPDVIFILQAPHEVLVERLQQREGRPVTPSEQKILRIFGSVYRAFLGSGRVVAVDAQASPEQTADAIVSIITDRIRKPER